MPAATNTLVVINDNMIRSMMRDPRFVEAFPCLAEVRRSLDKLVAKDCQTCKRVKARRAAMALHQGKNCLATLPAEKRATLKKLLNTGKVRIIRVNAKGASVRVTY